MKKRIVATSLALVLLTGTGVPALGARTGFSDVPGGYWAGEAIREMAGKGVITGDQTGTFRPGQNVTNAQFAVILARAFYPEEARAYESEGCGGPAPWYWASAAALRDHGVLQSTSMGEDEGWPKLECDGAPVTRYEIGRAHV